MLAEELAAIPQWIEREVVGKGIPRLYADLASILQNNANGSPQSFATQKEELIDAIEGVASNVLTDAQRHFIEDQLKLLPHLGRRGVESIESILFRNSLDIATAAREMGKISGEVQWAVDRSSQIKSALSGLVELDEVVSEEVLLRVVFDHKAAIQDITDFKKWAAEWHDIGRGIAMSVGETPKDVRVVGAQTGSIIITLATTYAIARVASSILLKALEVAERVQGLRKVQLEIEAMKLSNQALLKALKEQEASEREDGLKSIATSVSEGLALDGEKVAALEKSITKLLAFIEKGGEVDVVLPVALGEAAGEGGVEQQKLIQNVEKIRELESQQKLMPFLSRDRDGE